MKYAKSNGVTLLELMLGLSVASLLILVLIQMLFMLGSQYQKAYAATQETIALQWAYELLNIRLYHAGFTPCKKLDKLDTTDARTSHKPLQSIEIDNHAKRLSIYGMRETQFSLAGITDSNTLIIKEKLSISAEHPVLIADCHHAEVHTIARVEHTDGVHKLMLTEPLVFHYSPEVYVGEWQAVTFYFKKHAKAKFGLFFRNHRADFLMPVIDGHFELFKADGYEKLEACLDTVHAKTRVTFRLM